MRTPLKVLVICFVVWSAMSCRKTNSSASSAETKEVSVSGSVKEDDPTTFTQADESVQIGGVNFATSSVYTISAYIVDAKGKKTQVYTGMFPSKDFQFKANVSNKYLIVEAVSNDRKFAATLPPPSNTNTVVNMLLDGPTTIAAKMFEVTASKAALGNQSARNALGNGTIAISEALMIASAVHLTVLQQIKENVTVSPINLSSLADSLVMKANAVFDALIAEGKSKTEIAQQISNKTYATVFGEYASTIPPAILAYRTNLDLGTSSTAKTEVAYEALKGTSVQTTVIAAFQTRADYYRTAGTVEAAASAENNVTNTYANTYRSCAVTNCISSSYVLPPPPQTINSTTGGSGSGGSGSSGSGSGVGSGGSVPTNLAQSVSFSDTNTTIGVISGSVNITKASSESDVLYYVLYWGTTSCAKVNGVSAVASIAKTGSNIAYTLTNTPIQAGASHLLVFTKNATGEMTTCVSTAITDADGSSAPKKLSFSFTAYAEYAAAPGAALQRYHVSNASGSWATTKVHESTGIQSSNRNVSYFQPNSSGRWLFYSIGNDTQGGSLLASESTDGGATFGSPSIIALAGLGQQSNRLLDAISFADGTPLAFWQYVDPSMGIQELQYRQGLSSSYLTYRSIGGTETIENAFFALNSAGTTAYLAMTKKDTSSSNIFQISLTSKDQSSSWSAESVFSPSDGCTQRKVLDFRMQGGEKFMLYDCWYNNSSWIRFYTYTLSGSSWAPPQTIDINNTSASKYSMFIDAAMKAHIVKAGTGALYYYTNASNSSFQIFQIDTSTNYAAGAISVDVNGIVYTTAMTIDNATKHIIAKSFIGTKSNSTYSWTGTTAADINLSSGTTIDTGLARNIIFEP